MIQSNLTVIKRKKWKLKVNRTFQMNDLLTDLWANWDSRTSWKPKKNHIKNLIQLAC